MGLDSGRSVTVGEVGPADPELAQAARKAVQDLNLIADHADRLRIKPYSLEGQPADFGEMTGRLTCRLCNRPIREHQLGEFCTR